ncbi:MAG: hypothetical protein E5V72_03410 [Mesorhizobium sp.]|uniref:hypothetical protein n=1 Tax=Mesorhizobium sp. TaxID=1871066 RepID=UPI000FE40EAC|nr:hypothetical protein [Mesorhizobium sp.]RWH49588.1 MAG: hypothetical protein EOQ80_06685 [Mesorhizobium sp.]RWI48394.1 MAG: hypothetical protein EOR15_13610 [Mesorhizobium sp.]RWI64043.1 MAG: hypothetical protein EOR18_30280 [Mesorhizobium sp.]RWI74806.1 MAG: hypothetical protein EOR19_20190 [Mesorhizobium sp.]RWI88145.1 MAG: hypothetical protein EOR20_03665 [Mesorhizobium sp.]
MPSKEQLIKAMDEWLSTRGLHPAEENMIEELKRAGGFGWAPLVASANMFAEVMPDIVVSAVRKARSQGKCKEWPSA